MALTIKKVVEKIVYFGDEYRKNRIFNKFDREGLQNDWWESLLFFFSRAFYQARTDDLSKKIEEAVVGILEQFEITNDEKFEELKLADWEPLQLALKEVIGREHIGKNIDIKLTIDSLKFIDKLFEKNLTNYCVEQIYNGKVSELFLLLQKRHSENGISTVGPNIASTYLCDIISLYNLEEYLSEEDLTLLQPIDFWVKQVCKKIELINNIDELEEIIRNTIEKTCDAYDLSSFKFHQGATYIGINSFDIIFDNLEKFK